MIFTAGTWDREDRNVYFLAGHHSGAHPLMKAHGFVLVAVNELTNEAAMQRVDRFLDAGCKVLLDSGIFALTNEHKRAHDITMNEALSLAPDEIDGFDELWDAYLGCVARFGDRLWGYIELDQGGKTNKRITRQRLNDLGLRPMPVYHPLNDGWDYFDELAQTHDRICWGNVVQADAYTRKRFLHTMWQRHREYPDLWIHVLGLTPNQWLNAMHVDSADSSTWLTGVRFGSFKERGMLRSLSDFDDEYKYVIGDTSDHSLTSDRRALAMSVASMSLMQRGWRHWEQRLREEFGLDAYPPLEADA